jgi:hypothetical protein
LLLSRRRSPDPSVVRLRLAAVAVLSLSIIAPQWARAQHDHGSAPPADAVDVAHSRMSSGTAWLPDATPLRAAHATLGGWSLMMHGAAFVQYVREFGLREAHQVGSVNWVMLVATHPFGGGALRVRAMASAEPLTLTGRGYPELLQVAMPYRGATVTDRQHPHDMLAEAAVGYERPLGGSLAVSLYAAPVGEPALGPVAYAHRPSAAYDPVAPLGHHLQDFTHISAGVVTLGAGTRRVRLEGSFFNGAHGDDVWTDVDPIALNSYAGRVSVNPSAGWSLAGWFGHLAPAGGAHAHGALDRFGASVLHTRPVGRGPEGKGGRGSWSTALIYGADLPEGTGHPLNTLLLESTLELDRSNAVFARVEYVRRTAADLALIGSVSDELNVGAVSGGYARTIGARGGIEAAVGLRGAVRLLPAALAPFYGSRTPVGVLAYLALRPGL